MAVRVWRNPSMPEKLRKRRERLAKSSAGTPKGGGSAATPRARKSRGRVGRKVKTSFTTQMAVLQDAGLPILRSLRILEGQLSEGPMKAALGVVSEDVETGASLSEAMAKHSAIFDELYVNMVRAGEASGALTTIFNRLSEFMEKTDALLRRIRSAFIYPAFIVGFATAIVTFIMIYVVPKFEDTFTQLGGQLPAMTEFLIGVSRWMVEKWYVLLAIPVLLWLTIVVMGRTVGGRRVLDRMKLRAWVFGPIALKSQVARFARTLGTLSNSGVPLLQALDIVAEASGNVVVRSGIDGVREAVREGEPMAFRCARFDTGPGMCSGRLPPAGAPQGRDGPGGRQDAGPDPRPHHRRKRRGSSPTAPRSSLPSRRARPRASRRSI